MSLHLPTGELTKMRPPRQPARSAAIDELKGTVLAAEAILRVRAQGGPPRASRAEGRARPVLTRRHPLGRSRRATRCGCRMRRSS